jgi:biotin carboxyl carrier protein
MPGTVLAVHAEVGAQVELGDTLVVMEAMKMELALKAPFAGTVAAVEIAVGDQVQLGDLLVLVEPEPAVAAA